MRYGKRLLLRLECSLPLCTNCVRGPGGALKLPQRVRAEPGRQTVLMILWSENEVWEGPKLSHQVRRSPAATHAFWPEVKISRDNRFRINPSHSSPLLPTYFPHPPFLAAKRPFTAARVFPFHFTNCAGSLCELERSPRGFGRSPAAKPV